jgi:hypothetical protein
MTLALHFASQFCIARRLDCNSIEAVAGLLSVARTTVSSVKVAYVISDKAGRSTVNNKYNNDPRKLLRGTRA